MKRLAAFASVFLLLWGSVIVPTEPVAAKTISAAVDLRGWLQSKSTLTKAQKAEIQRFVEKQDLAPVEASCIAFHGKTATKSQIKLLKERARSSCLELSKFYFSLGTTYGTRVTQSKSMLSLVRISLKLEDAQEVPVATPPHAVLPTIPPATGCQGKGTMLANGLFGVDLRVVSALSPNRPLRSSGAFQLTSNGWKYLPGNYSGFIRVEAPDGSHALDTLPSERAAFLSKRIPYTLQINADGTYSLPNGIMRNGICDLLVGASPQAEARWKAIRSPDYKPAFTVSPAVIPTNPIVYRAPVSVLRSPAVNFELYPWEGRNVVLLTQGNHHDPTTIAKYLEAVDRAWEFYDSMTGQFPKRGPDKSVWSRTYNGKAVIAGIPSLDNVDSAKFMSCGGNGCGAYETLGIELRWQVVESSLQMIEDFDMFDHTVFYELGRTFWNEAKCGPVLNMTQGDTVTPTGFAVLMRYVSMDHVGLTLAPDTEIDGSDFKKSLLKLEEGLFEDKSLNLNSMTSPIFIRGLDRNAIWASLMNRVGEQNGGVQFYSKFFQNCSQLGRATSSVSALKNWKTLSEFAAGKNLDALFVDRWRFSN
jgi:hypothetical protein